MKDAPLLIYGAGGFAREVAWLAEICQDHRGGLEPAGFIDDGKQGESSVLNGLPVWTLDEAIQCKPRAWFVAAIGNPKTRQLVTEKAISAGLRPARLVHPGVILSRFVEMGEGAVVCAGSHLTTNIVLGKGVQVNLDCTIGHDAILNDYVTLAPGCHISGNVHLGKRVYIGTGAVIINGTTDSPLVIGDDSVVGAGACVTKSIGSGLTAVGVPARPIGKPVAA